VRLAENHAYKILADAVKNKNGSLELGALSRILASDAILAISSRILRLRPSGSNWTRYMTRSSRRGSPDQPVY
jgi:hypothetical protein